MDEQALRAKIKELIDSIFIEADQCCGNLSGIAMGIPGIVAPNGKDIFHTPNIDLSGFPLAEKIAENFDTAVILGNDVNCGLLGEKWLGVAKDAKNVIGIFPGTGVGGAMILNGKIYTGSQGAAAEFGHMIMDYDSPINHAGVVGSLEALASRRAIEKRIREAVKDGEKTKISP